MGLLSQSWFSALVYRKWFLDIVQSDDYCISHGSQILIARRIFRDQSTRITRTESLDATGRDFATV